MPARATNAGKDASRGLAPDRPLIVTMGGRPPARTEVAEEEGEAGPASGTRSLPPRWVPVTATVICVLAVLDSAYLTYAHFTSASVLACPTKGFIDCGLVTTSSYSHPFGIPVAVAGLGWSLVMLALCSPRAWRAASAWVSRARLVLSVGGVAMVFYLLWAELIKLRHLCEYCTGVHVLTVALFVVIVFGTALSQPADGEEEGAGAGAEELVGGP